MRRRIYSYSMEYGPRLASTVPVIYYTQAPVARTRFRTWPHSLPLSVPLLTRMRVYISMYTHTSVFIYIYMHTHVCVHIYMVYNTHTRMCVYIHTTCTHTRLCAHTHCGGDAGDDAISGGTPLAGHGVPRD
jgi:hypothetical protein